MADQRCPMCGKPNPANAETCKYCGARLKPVRPGESKPTAPISKGGEGDADWMSDLRGDMMRNRPKTSMLPPEPPAPPPPSDNWLSKIDARGEKNPSRPPPLPSKNHRRPPRPLRRRKKPLSLPTTGFRKSARRPGKKPRPRRRFRLPPRRNHPQNRPSGFPRCAARPRPDRPAEPEEEKPGEEPVWLKRLRASRTQDELVQPAPPQPAEETAAPGELPEWLSKIREKTTTDSDRIDAEDHSLFSAPLTPAAPAPTVPPKPTPGSPWGTAAPPQKPRAIEPPAPPTPQGSVPDWLKYPSETNQPAAEEPPLGSADWMGGIASALEQTPPTPSAKPGEPPGRPSTGRLLGTQDASADKKAGSARPTGRIGASPTKKISPPTQPFREGPVPPASGPTPSALGPDWDFPAEPAPDYPFAQPAPDANVSSGLRRIQRRNRTGGFARRRGRDSGLAGGY